MTISSDISSSIYWYVNLKFCNICKHASLQCVYHMKEAVPAVVGSIMIIGVDILCITFFYTCDL